MSLNYFLEYNALKAGDSCGAQVIMQHTVTILVRGKWNSILKLYNAYFMYVKICSQA